jgi:hypothetical protein
VARARGRRGIPVFGRDADRGGFSVPDVTPPSGCARRLPSKGRIYKAHPKHYNDLIM